MSGNAWRVSEMRTLTDAVRAARSPSEIQIPGRTAGAVRAMASRLRLVGDGIPRKKWPDPDVRVLRQLVADGWTAKRIADANALPGHGRNAIQKQMQRLGLGRPERSLPQKVARRMPADLMDRFVAFLTAHAPAHPPVRIAELWNATSDYPVSHQRVRYHLARLALGLASPRVCQMVPLAAPSRVIVADHRMPCSQDWMTYVTSLDRSGLTESVYVADACVGAIAVATP